MCGFAAIVNNLGARDSADLVLQLENMGALLAHRGPDDNGLFVNSDHTVGFVHRRLSIIGLE